MGRKRKINEPPKFYICVDCGKQGDRGMMMLASRKIDLYPCGLPIIDGNILYTPEEQDLVQKTCVRLGRHEICTPEMAGKCVDLICERSNKEAKENNKT